MRPERFELPTPWFVAKYSIQMSYGRLRGADYTQEIVQDKPASALCSPRIVSIQCFWLARTFLARVWICSAETSSCVLSFSSSQSKPPLMTISATSM